MMLLDHTLILILYELNSGWVWLKSTQFWHMILFSPNVGIWFFLTKLSFPRSSGLIWFSRILIYLPRPTKFSFKYVNQTLFSYQPSGNQYWACFHLMISSHIPLTYSSKLTHTSIWLDQILFLYNFISLTYSFDSIYNFSFNPFI